MQVNLKDNIYSALKTLADKEGKSIEVYLEQLVRREVGKNQPAMAKDSAWATIYERQPRFDSGTHGPNLIKQVQQDILSTKERAARDSYIERLKRKR